MGSGTLAVAAPLAILEPWERVPQWGQAPGPWFPPSPLGTLGKGRPNGPKPMGSGVWAVAAPLALLEPWERVPQWGQAPGPWFPP